MSDWIVRVQEPGIAAVDHVVTSGVTFGRHPENTVTLYDPKVSSHHSEIRLVEGTWVLMDRGSLNHTAIQDGPELREGESVPLRHAMHAIIGRTTLVFFEEGRVPAPDSSDSAPPPEADSFADASTVTSPGRRDAEPRRRPLDGPAPRGDDGDAPPPGLLDWPEPDGPEGGELRPEARPLSAEDRALLDRVRPRLLVRVGSRSERHLLEKGALAVGRVAGEGAGDCAIDHDTVAARHATLYCRGGRFLILDHGSRHGTWLGEDLLLPHRAHELAPDRVVRFGTVDALFTCRPRSEAQAVGHRKALEVLGREKGVGAGALRAAAKAATAGRHPADELILAGRITPGQWVEAVQKARILQMTALEGRGLRPARRWKLLVLLAAITLALTAILLIWGS